MASKKLLANLCQCKKIPARKGCGILCTGHTKFASRRDFLNEQKFSMNKNSLPDLCRATMLENPPCWLKHIDLLAASLLLFHLNMFPSLVPTQKKEMKFQSQHMVPSCTLQQLSLEQMWLNAISVGRQGSFQAKHTDKTHWQHWQN